MKKIISTLMIIAAAAISFSSCQKQEMITPDASQEVTLTFSSEKPAFADETKTEWNGETIQWSKGDKISIAYTVNGTWQNASGDASGDAKLYKSTELKDASSTAQFNVSAYFKGETEGAHVFYGVYPAPESTNIPNAPEVSVEVPALQTLKSDTFDSSADLMTGVSINDFSARPTEGETISMEWTRLVAHAFITIKTLNGATEGEKVSNIVLTAQDDANIVGMQKVNLVSNQVTKDNTKANVLNLSGGNVFVDAEGTVYVWACVLPETLTSLTVKVDTDKATYTRAITDISKTFKQNARNLLTINMSKAERVEKVVDPEESVNTGTLTFDDASKRIVSTTSQQVWSENNITLTYDKADYTSNLAEYAKPVRFYKGTTITVEAPGNISVIEFACNTTAYATALNSSITGSTLNEKVVTVTLDGDARSVTYTMGAQVRMDAITVTYSNSGSGETPDTTPSITVAETLELTSAEAEGTISVTYKNLEELEAAAYSDEECTTECDWLIALWENGAVSYLAEANEGDERTAYIQIYALDADANEFTKVITVTQEGKPTVDTTLDGDYWIYEPNAQKVMAPIAETETSARPGNGIATVTDGNVATFAVNNFKFAYDADMQAYTIKDSYGRYLYSGYYNGNVSAFMYASATLPEGSSGYWSATRNSDGTYVLLNKDTNYELAYDASYSNWSLYASGHNKAYPTLVKADNPLVVELSSISVSGYKTSFVEGESFEFGGDVTATYTDGSTKDVTDHVFVTEPTTMSDGAKVSVSYTEGTITKSFEYIISVKAAGAEVELKTVTLSFADKAQRTTFTTSQQIWEQNGIKLTNNKASSTTNVADYANPARFYAGSNLELTAPGLISEIVFDANTSSYATTMKTSIGTVSGATVTVSSDKVTVTYSTPVASFSIAKFSAQVRMDSITVTYLQ